jgi:DNA repair protein RecN (Recombination protein N)
MLTGLSVSNFAIVENITLDLNDGLTVITGETGAGKSILVGALLLGLGERWQSDSIRPGKEKSTIELVFNLNEEQQDLLDDPSLVDGNELIVSRSMDNKGKGRIRLSGVASTLSTLRGAVSRLVDVHSQFEVQSLLNPQIQLSMLDRFAGRKHLKTVENFKSLTDKLTELTSDLRRLQQQDEERLKRIDFIQFELDEFDRIKPQVGEEDELRQERNRLNNIQKLAELAGNTKIATDGEDELQGILSLSRLASKQLQELKRIDSTAEEIANHMATIEASANEASVQLADYLSELSFNPDRLEEIEMRLAELEKMIRRHGSCLEDVFAGVEKYQREIDELKDSENRLGQINSEIKKLREETGSLGLMIRKTREETGNKLSKLIESQLSDLALGESTFKIVQNEVQPTEDVFCTINGNQAGMTKTGLDHLEFYISTNPGIPPEPISKVASGGELSRIMLAMKVILAEVDSIPTLVFDEVDAGVGGRIGEMIGRKLARLAQNRQVICITHLPQIAVFADTHLRIVKSVKDGETSIDCMELEKRGCIDEIARMGSGDRISQVSLKHAQEMLVSANKFKKSLSHSQ